MPGNDMSRINPGLVVAVAKQRAAGRFAHHIAADAGIHPSELSRWLNGRREPTVAQAARLAAALGEPVELLFPDLKAQVRPSAEAPTKGAA